jgi:V/A-type H+-transporting ATPase subunit D
VADLPGGISPTRSAYLELKDERRQIREGYEFLDEKRLLLAAELLRRLRDYESLRQELGVLWAEARAALAGACGRHGLEGLQVLPVGPIAETRWTVEEQRFLGVMLIDGSAELTGTDPGRGPVNPSPESRECGEAFSRLAGRLGELALAEASLIRLARDYTRTERRARALENVLLPELQDALHFMDEQLEAMDQEEAIRVRRARAGD